MRDDDDEILKAYYADIRSIPLLAPEEEAAICERLRNGDRQAANLLVEGNLRLVVSIAKTLPLHGMTLLDLIAEGNVGLMRAAKTYSPDKGTKFSTYAAMWIRQRMYNALDDKSRVIRLPRHIVDKLRTLRKAAAALELEQGCPPSAKDIAEATGVPLKKVANLMTVGASTLSLNEAAWSGYGDDATTELGETIVDHTCAAPVVAIINDERREQLLSVLHLLDERERYVINARFGLGDTRSMSLEELGKRWKITRERIRQIQNIALGKLKGALNRRAVAERMQLKEKTKSAKIKRGDA